MAKCKNAGGGEKKKPAGGKAPKNGNKNKSGQPELIGKNKKKKN